MFRTVTSDGLELFQRTFFILTNLNVPPEVSQKPGVLLCRVDAFRTSGVVEVDVQGLVKGLQQELIIQTGIRQPFANRL